MTNEKGKCTINNMFDNIFVQQFDYHNSFKPQKKVRQCCMLKVQAIHIFVYYFEYLDYIWCSHKSNTNGKYDIWNP